ncbi:uncharacterized protein [Canis lupus baileyi]|uniref:uncharacterized protein n=1 Tax=Canis lupus baileyi TaxID=143281 RepID=UPI003B96A9F9
MLTWLEIIYPRACFPAASTCLDVAEGGLHALPAVPPTGSVLAGLPDASGHLEGRVERTSKMKWKGGCRPHFNPYRGAVVPGCPAGPAWNPTQSSRTWLPSQGTGACLGRPVTLPKPLYLVQVLHRTLVLEEELTEAEPEASWSPQQLVVAAATDPLQSEDLDPAAEAAAEATPARDLQAFPSVRVMLPAAAAPPLVPASCRGSRKQARARAGSTTWGPGASSAPPFAEEMEPAWDPAALRERQPWSYPHCQLPMHSFSPMPHSTLCGVFLSPIVALFAFVFVFTLSLFVFVFSHSFCCSLLWILNRFSYFQLSNS